MSKILVNKRQIGTGFPCYIIAEIGSNFDGNVNKAKKLIRMAKKAGADAAKFQSFSTEKIIEKKGFEKKNTFQKKWKESVWDIYKKAEFHLTWHKELDEYAKKMGIDFLSAPYYKEAVDMLVKLNTPIIKIGSGEITNWDLLRYIGKTKKPILLATGASTLKEVEKAIKNIKKTKNDKIILMQSITQYPSPIEQANLRVLETFKKKFHVNVGYSDHSTGDLIVLASVVLGACVIEKHFTLNKKSKGPDHPHSMEPDEFSKMVKKIRLLEQALGDGVKKIESSEKETRIIQRRGIWTSKEISKGEKLSCENITALRPMKGIPASEFTFILNKRVKRKLKAHIALKKTDYY